jgi:hypothetical protein
VLKKFSTVVTPVSFALCLFVFILGVRWAVFDRYGMTLPEWDQWDAEGLMLLAPWFNQDGFLSALFTPHNEHRVVLTKLLNLGLTLANGHWDQRLEAVVNALFPATLGVVFFVLARRHLERRWLAPFTVFLGLIYALPFAWENVLGGFQSQQFFLVGLALVAIAFLPFSAPLSARWWLGVVGAFLGLLSMASGLFGAVVVIGLHGLQWLRRERTLRSGLPTLVVCTVAALVGWFTRNEFPPHEGLKAHNFHDFAFTIINSLRWPAPFSPWFALILWLPWTWLVYRTVFSPRPLAPPSRSFGYFVIGLGVWVWLQLVATGYARGAGGPQPAPRYLDTLIFGLVTNALALVWLATPALLARLARRCLAGVAIAWTGILVWGACSELTHSLRMDLPPTKVYHDYCEINVRNYMYTGEIKHLDHDEIPYPGANAFLARIGIPALRAVLPVTVRPPLTVTETGSSFIPASPDNHSPPGPGLSPVTQPLTYRKTWGSFSLDSAPTVREFTSAPIHAPLGAWLKFETAGAIGAPDTILELRDAKNGTRLAPIRPNQTPGNTWRAAYVRAPAEAFVIYARSPDSDRWLAFSEPIEMANGSYWAWQLTKHGQLIAAVALALSLLLSVVALAIRRWFPIGQPSTSNS